MPIDPTLFQPVVMGTTPKLHREPVAPNRVDEDERERRRELAEMDERQYRQWLRELVADRTREFRELAEAAGVLDRRGKRYPLS